MTDTPSSVAQEPMTIVARLRAMPSSLNDACRTMEQAAEEIERFSLPSTDQQPSFEEKLKQVKDRIDTRLNDVLSKMKPGRDDSIVGFNDAWDIVSIVFKAEFERAAWSSLELTTSDSK